MVMAVHTIIQLGPYLIGSAWLPEGASHSLQSGFALHDALVVQLM
jgi:hypothetical protein